MINKLNKFFPTSLNRVGQNLSLISLQEIRFSSKHVFILFFLVIIPDQSFSMSVLDYQNSKNDKVEELFVDLYLRGLTDGFLLINTNMNVERNIATFCPPEKMALTVDQYKYLLDESIKNLNDNEKKEYPISLILLNSLKEKLPCNN